MERESGKLSGAGTTVLGQFMHFTQRKLCLKVFWSLYRHVADLGQDPSVHGQAPLEVIREVSGKATGNPVSQGLNLELGQTPVLVLPVHSPQCFTLRFCSVSMQDAMYDGACSAHETLDLTPIPPPKTQKHREGGNLPRCTQSFRGQVESTLHTDASDRPQTPLCAFCLPSKRNFR
ncbi:hypothetical protein E5288_WYG012096 [Bos mutus]|uniref:Uncharacterized protein n=1 Tax=Bos mutus TaxID=72004 RepID=A0A6B0R1Q3_9CETA|nr:hypothetical protein [Bos mutus]